jgi:hypothetical protein
VTTALGIRTVTFFDGWLGRRVRLRSTRIRVPPLPILLANQERISYLFAR